MNGSIGEKVQNNSRNEAMMSSVTQPLQYFLERTMAERLWKNMMESWHRRQKITNLRFADDIDALAQEEQELEALVKSLDKTCTRYQMEISAEKT